MSDKFVVEYYRMAMPEAVSTLMTKALEGTEVLPETFAQLIQQASRSFHVAEHAARRWVDLTQGEQQEIAREVGLTAQPYVEDARRESGEPLH